MDDLDPEKLWEDKGADYIAPYDEVLERVARWLEADLQELWDRNTTFKHPWFLARNAGLRAWSYYEADLRLKPFYREKYTLADYCEFKLVERMQTHGEAEVKDPSWSDFISFKTQTEGPQFWRRTLDKSRSETRAASGCSPPFLLPLGPRSRSVRILDLFGDAGALCRDSQKQGGR